MHAPAQKSTLAKPRRRRLLPWLGAAALVALLVVGLWPQATPVESGEVRRGPLVVTVDEEGMTRVKNRYVVSAPIAGQLDRVDWKAGAPVVAGKTVLATMESSGSDFLDARSLAQAEARVHGAAAARDAAGAQRDRTVSAAKLAKAEFERIKQLRAENVASAQEFDAAEMRRDTALQDSRAAEFSLKVSEYELEQARALLTRGTAPSNGTTAADLPPLVITSPVDGKILRVFQESARVIPAGVPLMEVGDARDLEVRIEVLSRDGVAIAPGARVALERWGGNQPLNARVRLVEPSAFTKISALGVEEQRVYVIADFTDPIEQRATLGDSYRVEARIVIWEKSDALHAPAGALFQRNGEWQTFVIAGNRARLRTIKIGRSSGVETEILDGLTAGERVVVYPGDHVFDGTRVKPLAITTR